MMIKFSVEGFSTAIKTLNKKGLEIFDTQSTLGHDRSNLSQKGDYALTHFSELK